MRRLSSRRKNEALLHYWAEIVSGTIILLNA